MTPSAAAEPEAEAEPEPEPEAEAEAEATSLHPAPRASTSAQRAAAAWAAASPEPLSTAPSSQPVASAGAPRLARSIAEPSPSPRPPAQPDDQPPATHGPGGATAPALRLDRRPAAITRRSATEAGPATVMRARVQAGGAPAIADAAGAAPAERSTAQGPAAITRSPAPQRLRDPAFSADALARIPSPVPAAATWADSRRAQPIVRAQTDAQPARLGTAAPAARAMLHRKPNANRSVKGAPATAGLPPTGPLAPPPSTASVPTPANAPAHALPHAPWSAPAPVLAPAPWPDPEPAPARAPWPDPAPALARAPEPAPAASRNQSPAERLAAASGGTIMREPTGETTVVFPTREAAPAGTAPQPAQQTRPTLARRTLAATTSTPPAAAMPAAPYETQHERRELADELYESFLERLRRDLLHERERSGHLVDDLF